MLQANFQLDSNPDGQDLERIAALTGLSKRVTQVWFQNSRARQKKYMNKNNQRLLSGTVNNITNLRPGTPGTMAMMINGGRSDSSTAIWSPASSTGSSVNDCLPGVPMSNHGSNSLSLEQCLNATVINSKWGTSAQVGSLIGNSQSSGTCGNATHDSNASQDCSESDNSSSPRAEHL